MTVLGRFGLHICVTFWVELNAIKIHMLQATFFVVVAAYIQHFFKNVPPLVTFGSPYCEILATGLGLQGHVCIISLTPIPLSLKIRKSHGNTGL